MNTSKNYKENGASPKNRHAVVLGGSLAGLLAARVLADHFEEVTLIERDVYRDAPETRRGIPQANVNEDPNRNHSRDGPLDRREPTEKEVVVFRLRAGCSDDERRRRRA